MHVFNSRTGDIYVIHTQCVCYPCATENSLLAAMNHPRSIMKSFCKPISSVNNLKKTSSSLFISHFRRRGWIFYAWRFI